MQCNNIFSYSGITQAFNSGVSIIESNKTPAAIAVTLVVSGLFYAWYTKPTYVDQLFTKRITSTDPSIDDSNIAPKERLEQHFETRGYDHLAVMPDQEGFPEPLEQIAQYVNNPRQFDLAVAEFAKFAIENCKGGSCLLGSTVVPSIIFDGKWCKDWATYQTLVASKLGDYQAFPLFMENGEGKIGITNPDISLDVNAATRNGLMSLKGNELINGLFLFFPFHKEILLEVFQKMHSSAGVNVTSLNQKVEEQKEILKAFSECHSLMLKHQDAQN